MLDNVIYEKKYPHMSHGDCERLFQETEKALFPIDSTKLYHRFLNKTVRVLLPERIQLQEEFILAVKEVSQMYELDTTIYQRTDRIIARLHVDSFNSFPQLKKAVSLSDEIRFFNENGDIIVELEFYTLAIYCSGRKVTP